MDLRLTPRQVAARDEVARHFAASGEFDLSCPQEIRSFWRACGRAGIQGLPESKDHGGAEAGIVAAVVALEELGYHCRQNGLPFGLSAQIWSVTRSIARFGTPEQKTRHVPGLISGELIGANCVSEVEAGSDIFGMRTIGKQVSGGYTLQGSKTFVTNAPIADVFLIFAQTDVASGVMGLSAFLVDSGHAGLTIDRTLPKMGLQGALMGDVGLTDCVVPQGALLGRPGQGFLIFQHALGLERGLILASQLGATRRLIEQTVHRSESREQFGRPIASFQAIAHRLAAMRTRLEASRLFILKSAWLAERDKRSHEFSAMTKLFVSEQLQAIAIDAMSIWGAQGYTDAHDVQAALLDAFGSQIYSGTSDIMRNIIASSGRFSG